MFSDRFLMRFSLLAVFISITKGANISFSEFNALEKLYYSTNGENWHWRANLTEFGNHWNFSGSQNPCIDRWQGISCYCTSTICSVVELKLNFYNLSGTLPAELGNLTRIYNLQVVANQLFGTIPSSISLMENLTNLDLSANQLTGNIISEFSLLNNLTWWSLATNKLKGTLPPALGSMKSIVDMDFSDNLLSGTIPTEFTRLVFMEAYDFNTNQFSGSLPYGFGKATGLKVFDFGANQLTGPLPSDLGNCTQLEVMDLHYNNFTGSIPESYNHLTQLFYFVLFDNQLTGTIPCLANMSNAVYVLLDTNYFTGTLCADFFTHKPYLIDFFVSNNSLTGSLPATLTSCSILTELFIYNNYLTGSIPTEIGKLQKLHYFVGSSNAFTGSFPLSMGNMSDLLTLSFYDNYLTGSLPNTIGNCKKLQYIVLYSNYLSSAIPSGLSEIPDLTVLLLQNNKFSGPIGQFLNVSAGAKLQNVDIANNQLTGTLPPEIFSLPYIESIAAVQNCIHGSIPIEACNATHLTVLALDGLHTSPACRNRLFPGIPSSITYTLREHMDGGILGCLLELPRLQTLHLSGNGLSGSFPSNLKISASLQDLSLSHNSLTGPIPDVIQTRSWNALDLSYNKLSGRLHASFASVPANGSLVLQVNRLSGPVPQSLLSAQNLSILNGNLFGCGYTHTQLPRHDKDYGVYECGSNSFDLSLVLWVVVLGASLIGLYILYWNKSKTSLLQCNEVVAVFVADWKRHMNMFHEESSGLDTSRQLIEFGKLLKRFRKGVLRLTLFAVVFMMPLYGILGIYYSIYEFDYAWTVSGGFKQGLVPGVILLLFLMLLINKLTRLAYKHLQIHRSTQQQQRQQQQQQSQEFHQQPRSQFQQQQQNAVLGSEFDAISSTRFTNTTSANTLRFTTAATGGGLQETVSYSRVACYYTLLVIAILINCTIVLTANFIYVVISVTYQSAVVDASQFLLAVFKLLWNEFGVRLLFYNASHYMNQRHLRGVLSPDNIMFQSFILLFNNILTPCLAITIISKNCYYDAIVPPPDVQTSFNLLLCSQLYPYGFFALSGKCLSESVQTFSTSYLPPFEYSYHCTSSFIRQYVAMFMYMFLLLTFGLPILTLLLKITYDKNKNSTRWFPRQCYLISSMLLTPLLKDVESSSLPGMLAMMHQQQMQGAESEGKKIYFQKDRFALRVISQCSVLLTFGILFPPLAIIVCISLLTFNYYTQYCVSHGVLQAMSAQNYEVVRRINDDTINVDHYMYASCWILIQFAAVFYSVFVMDTIAGETGWRGAIWAPVLMCLTPRLTWWSLMFVDQWNLKQKLLKLRSRAEEILSGMLRWATRGGARKRQQSEVEFEIYPAMKGGTFEGLRKSVTERASQTAGTQEAPRLSVVEMTIAETKNPIVTV